MSFDYINMVIRPMLEGTKITLLLFFIVIATSIPLGFIITLLGRTRFKPLTWL